MESTMKNSENNENALLPPPDVLLQVRTGRIRPLGGSALRSAIAKSRRPGRIVVTGQGLDGDQQQYALHGGVDKALHQYCAAHYGAWRAERPDRAHLFQVGGFGENLSSTMLTEDNVCIGDIFSVGHDVVVQVSEPRQPCYKLNHRFEWQRASIRTQESGRTGWYLRVLKPGTIAEGDTIELVERLHPRWTITEVQKYLYREVRDLAALIELSQLPELGQEIRDLFQDRLDKGMEDMDQRLAGIPGRNRIPVPWKPYRLVEEAPITPRVKRLVFVAEADDDADADVTRSDIRGTTFGTFAHVRLKFGPDACFSRSYSVVGGDTARFELGVARDDASRGGSIWLHDNLRIGDIVSVARGNEPAQRSVASIKKAARHIFIVAGVGVTAFLREIESLEGSCADYEVHYAVRSEVEAAYLAHLPPDFTKVYARSRAERMNVATVIPPPTGTDSETAIYCCGPPSLLRACREQTSKLGYPDTSVHLQDFGGAADSTGEPFEAMIRHSGQVLHIPGNKSLLQVLNSAGLDIPSSCRAGHCAICMVDCVSGEVEHRGAALDEEQKRTSMLACVSRGKGRLVLDC